ncbi:MAG: hypothetical protein EOP84_30585 [Verrucomicrobiaceae bacterium]|nr:MAG: hypothetical protein EOP84_30585 [Verrucomicrobiaceae bacterium]
MTESEYTAKVRAVLNQHSNEARARLAKLPGLLPEKTKAMEITIFVDQMGEGFLTVRVALTGPDLHVLNKAIGEAAILFETKMVKDELVPPLPLMDPFEEEFAVAAGLVEGSLFVVEAAQLVDALVAKGLEAIVLDQRVVGIVAGTERAVNGCSPAQVGDAAAMGGVLHL